MSAWIISGPTGSGKTDLALSLSKEFKRSLFNADPFQFYKEIPILSNQPKTKMSFLGFESITSPKNAGDFSRLAKPYLQSDGIWVGTGLYLGAAFYGLDEDRKKGTPFQGRPLVSFKMIVLSPPRDKLYRLLNERVDVMIERGALNEAQKVLSLVEDGQISNASPLLKAIGLKHLMMMLRSEVSKDKAIELWKRDTRHLAKRQWTWLRKFCAESQNIQWIERFGDEAQPQEIERMIFKNSR